MRNVDRHKAPDQFRVCARQMPSYHAAPIVADDGCILVSKVVNEPDDIIPERIDVVRSYTIRLVAFIISTLVGGDDPVSRFGQLTDLSSPAEPELRKPWSNITRSPSSGPDTATWVVLRSSQYA